jgi:hypothetical protein
MATAAKFVQPIPIFLAYLVPLAGSCHGNKKRGDFKKKLISFIKLYETL